MNTPHKWAKEIHAFADGAVIELYSDDWGWLTEKNPQWLHDVMYRIKPAPVVQWITVSGAGYADDLYLYKAEALLVASRNNQKLMRLEINHVTFAATYVLEDV